MLSCKVVSSPNGPLILAFIGLSNHGAISFAWIYRQRFSTLNALEGVVAVHGREDTEKELILSREFVCTSRTGMPKPPSQVVALESNLDPMIHMEADSEVNVEADGELLAEVGAEWDTMEVTESLDE